MTLFVLDLQTANLTLNTEQFYRLCQANRDLRLERTTTGNLVIMPPTGWETGYRNSKLIQQLTNWSDGDGQGFVFDSSTGFLLPNGAIRSPDTALVKRDRIDALNPDPDRFLSLCPDFVIELRSSNDNLVQLQEKMQDYLENGLRLGWLINPQAREVEIYRAEQPVEVLQSPNSLSGEAVLSNFILDLTKIW
ncbi:MAG: Uma2 family endonuclease [Kamptonema sp. SIO4C4]|nr:Uma2 family endonuclease [Kamptonema sp. SIO4C4]